MNRLVIDIELFIRVERALQNWEMFEKITAHAKPKAEPTEIPEKTLVSTNSFWCIRCYHISQTCTKALN